MHLDLLDFSNSHHSSFTFSSVSFLRSKWSLCVISMKRERGRVKSDTLDSTEKVQRGLG